MNTIRTAMSLLVRSILPLLLALACAAPVQAAESYGNCTGFIDSLPATVSTQGVWCLRQDLTTAQASGAAITIAANNVTVDCNDYKVGGLPGGVTTDAIGVLAGAGRLNAVVRHCNLRGFHTGIRTEGAGHLVEDNRIDASTVTGINVQGDASVIRRNTVSNTGHRPGRVLATGILAMGTGARVLDNDIHGVRGNFDLYEGVTAIGIDLAHGLARDNRVSGLEAELGTEILGIRLLQAIADGNDLVSTAYVGGPAIDGDGEDASVCRDNRISAFFTGAVRCAASGNVHAPGN